MLFDGDSTDCLQQDKIFTLFTINPVQGNVYHLVPYNFFLWHFKGFVLEIFLLHSYIYIQIFFISLKLLYEIVFLISFWHIQCWYTESLVGFTYQPFQKCFSDMSFLIESLQPLTHRIIPSANRDELASPFLFYIYFISSSSIISLAKPSSTSLNKTGESRQPHLTLDLQKKMFSGSPICRWWFCPSWSHSSFSTNKHTKTYISFKLFGRMAQASYWLGLS